MNTVQIGLHGTQRMTKLMLLPAMQVLRLEISGPVLALPSSSYAFLLSYSCYYLSPTSKLSSLTSLPRPEPWPFAKTNTMAYLN